MKTNVMTNEHEFYVLRTDTEQTNRRTDGRPHRQAPGWAYRHRTNKQTDGWTTTHRQAPGRAIRTQNKQTNRRTDGRPHKQAYRHRINKQTDKHSDGHTDTEQTNRRTGRTKTPDRRPGPRDRGPIRTNQSPPRQAHEGSIQPSLLSNKLIFLCVCFF